MALLQKKFKRGFTLVEIITILIVIAALILLSYISVPTILARARDAKRKGDIKRMAIAIAEFYDDKNCYPQTIPVCNNKLLENDTTLLSNIPCDPRTENSYVYVPESNECPSWFQLYGNLEYLADSIIDRVGCRNGCGPDCQFNYGTSSPNQKLNPYCEEFPAPAPGPTPEGDDDNGDDNGDDERPNQYVCGPSGSCEIYADPVISGCPDIYPDDPTCQDACSLRENRCHDERGKLIP